MNLMLLRRLIIAMLLAMGSVSMVQASSGDELEQRIDELERLLREVKQQQTDAKMEMQKHKEKRMAMKEKMKEEMKEEEKRRFSLSPESSKLSFYGSIRPALTYFGSQINDIHNFSYEIRNPENPNSSIEVTDFFTRIGIKGETDIGYGITAFARGEMEVAIDQGGQFDPRLAFAGVKKGDLGTLAIGRQDHPHYNTIVEVTDLYNHRSSPFGYDQQGPFRRSNLVTYSNSIDVGAGSIKLDIGGQFSESGRGQQDDGVSNRPGLDSGSVGLAFKNDLFYLGASYLERKLGPGASREYKGVGAGVNISDDLYLAVTYQDITQDNNASDGHSLDLVGSYAFGNGYNLILGYFDVDETGDPVPGQEPCAHEPAAMCTISDYTDGLNVTLQRQMSDNFSIFVEWLRFDYDDVQPNEEDSVDAISVGLRYDFSLEVL